MNRVLLIIDPQNDFVDPHGSLSIPVADMDMNRLSTFIQNEDLNEITVTMDSHSEFDIAHPLFWTDSAGRSPNPFTGISADHVKNGKWHPKIDRFKSWSIKYVEKLEENGKYQLTIWPPHCITGSWGQAVWPQLSDTLRQWERNNSRPVNYILKGQNILTEHYSAVKAEVTDPQDDSTKLNQALINSLQKEEIEEIFIAGEALSHCVAETVRDLADNFSKENIKKMTLLTDCTSTVPGFEALGKKFTEDLTALGMKLKSVE